MIVSPQPEKFSYENFSARRGLSAPRTPRRYLGTEEGVGRG